VSAVVAAHHGTVGVTSPPTTFTVRLPTTPPPGPAAVPASPVVAPGATLPAGPAERSGRGSGQP
jgi:hypothetical protein